MKNIFIFVFLLTTHVAWADTSLGTPQPTSWDNLVSEIHRVKAIPEGHAYIKKQTLGCSSKTALQRLLVAFNANNLKEAQTIKECRGFSEKISIKIIDIYNPLNAYVHLNLPEGSEDTEQYVMLTNIAGDQ